MGENSESDKVPKVIKYGYICFTRKEKLMSATCSFCREKTVITDKIGTTSNFVKHLQRIHPDQYV